MREDARLVVSLRRSVSALGEKVFPSHWSFLLGELALFCFAVLVLTGLYLAWFYEPSSEVVVYQGSHDPLAGVEMTAAYASVIEITFDTPAGAIVRQTHHWAAVVFVGVLVLHVGRVFFTGAYRRPRRLNWLVGLSLLALALTAGFFGLALPHDTLGGTGSRIGYAFATSIPVVGTGVAEVVFDGELTGEGMLPRIWLLHVIIIPLTMAGLLGLHLLLVFRQSHTQFASTDRPERDADPDDEEREVRGTRAWPTHALTMASLFAITAGVLLGLGAIVQIAPVWLYGPYDPAVASVPAQPDWYLGWVEGALRILPGVDLRLAGGEVPSPFLTGVLLSLVVFTVLAVWPFLEARVTRDRRSHHLLQRPRDHPVRTAVGTGGVVALAVLLMAGSHDLQAMILDVHIDSVTTTYRVALFVGPVVAGLLAYRTCRDLAATEADRSGVLATGEPLDVEQTR